VEMEPTNSHAIGWLGYTYERMGNYKQAMEQWTKLERAQGHDEHAAEIMQAFEKSGYSGYLRKDAKRAEAEHDYNTVAADYAMLGDKNAAFGALEKVFADRAGVVFIKVVLVST